MPLFLLFLSLLPSNSPIPPLFPLTGSKDKKELDRSIDKLKDSTDAVRKALKKAAKEEDKSAKRVDHLEGFFPSSPLFLSFRFSYLPAHTHCLTSPARCSQEGGSPGEGGQGRREEIQGHDRV